MTLMKNVNGVDVPLTPEEEAEYNARQAAWIAGANNRNILSQIAILEAQITSRRIREAIRGNGKAWLDNIDDQIAVLRAQLT